jgi:hypothetical protein
MVHSIYYHKLCSYFMETDLQHAQAASRLAGPPFRPLQSDSCQWKRRRPKNSWRQTLAAVAEGPLAAAATATAATRTSQTAATSRWILSSLRRTSSWDGIHQFLLSSRLRILLNFS